MAKEILLKNLDGGQLHPLTRSQLVVHDNTTVHDEIEDFKEHRIVTNEHLTNVDTHIESIELAQQTHEQRITDAERVIDDNTVAIVENRNEINRKQFEADAIVIDPTPTPSSENLVRSGAIYTYGEGIRSEVTQLSASIGKKDSMRKGYHSSGGYAYASARVVHPFEPGKTYLIKVVNKVMDTSNEYRGTVMLTSRVFNKDGKTNSDANTVVKGPWHQIAAGSEDTFFYTCNETYTTEGKSFADETTRAYFDGREGDGADFLTVSNSYHPTGETEEAAKAGLLGTLTIEVMGEVMNPVTETVKKINDNMVTTGDVVGSVTNKWVGITVNPFTLNHIGGINMISRLGSGGTGPEQSLIRYKSAYKNGYRIMLCDLRHTSDGVLVGLHDDTINRIARNDDETEISETVYIANITLAEALTYDFGLSAAPNAKTWKGTRIMQVKDFLAFCKFAGCIAHLEFKYAFTDSQITNLATLVKSMGMENSVMFNTPEAYPGNLTKIAACFPKAPLGLWVSSIDSSKIVSLKALSNTNPLFFYIGTYNNLLADIIANVESYGDSCAAEGISIGITNVGETPINTLWSAGVMPYFKYVAADVNLYNILWNKLMN